MKAKLNKGDQAIIAQIIQISLMGNRDQGRLANKNHNVVVKVDKEELGHQGEDALFNQAVKEKVEIGFDINPCSRK